MLPERPNNALMFTITHTLLARPAIEVVYYGPESLENLPNLDHFKFDMGYVQQPLRQLAILNPRWRTLASPVVNRALAIAASRATPGGSLRKMAGVSLLVQATRTQGAGAIESRTALSGPSY